MVIFSYLESETLNLCDFIMNVSIMFFIKKQTKKQKYTKKERKYQVSDV